MIMNTSWRPAARSSATAIVDKCRFVHRLRKHTVGVELGKARDDEVRLRLGDKERVFCVLDIRYAPATDEGVAGPLSLGTWGEAELWLCTEFCNRLQWPRISHLHPLHPHPLQGHLHLLNSPLVTFLTCVSEMLMCQDSMDLVVRWKWIIHHSNSRR